MKSRNEYTIIINLEGVTMLGHKIDVVFSEKSRVKVDRFGFEITDRPLRAAAI